MFSKTSTAATAVSRLLAPLRLRSASAPARLLLAFGCLLLLLLLALAQLEQLPLLTGGHQLPSGDGRTGPIILYHDRFQYLINSDVCSENDAVTAVVVVHSDPRHPEVRDAIRRSLPTQLLRGLGVRRAFMLADASEKLAEKDTTVLQSAIDTENALHQDLVQGNFHDSYHNLTYKHIMALDWASTFCPQARKIIKMDDDIVYDIFELLKAMQLIPDSGYLGGNIFYNAEPFRGQSKWKVSLVDWPRKVYPPYLSGWLYIITPDVARQLVLQSTVVPFFWIDDTFVTGILAEQLHITVKGFKSLFVTTYECIKYTVQQDFDLASESKNVIYQPGFVIGPSEKDLLALETFNRLTRYCANYTCQSRARYKLCQNRY